MGLFNYLRDITLVKKSEYTQAKKGLDELKKLDSSMRPAFGDENYNNRNQTASYLQRFGLGGLSLWDLYHLSKHSSILQLIFNARNREIFRNGYYCEPTVDMPSEDQKDRAVDFFESCNENGQSLMEVLQEWSTDLDWADDAYLLLLKDYKVNDDNEIVGADVKEALRLNPLIVEMVVDSRQRIGYFDEGSGKDAQAYTSVTDRTILTKDSVDKKTGIPNIRAHYMVRGQGGNTYYNKSEVYHRSDFNPTATYGLSPLYSYYNELITLMAQTSYMKRYYSDNKPIRGLLAINTSNKDGVWAMFDKLKAKVRNNPHDVHPLVMENKEGNKSLEYINMAQTLVEMQYSETRNELRNFIGALYGVSPVFQNDVSVGGGLNNEGLQITVTNRAVEARQNILNKEVLQFIFSQMGITDWEIGLNPSEEQDELHEIELESKKLQVAKQKLELGLQGRVEQDEIIFTDGELELQAQDQQFVPFSNEQMSEGTPDEVVVQTPVNVSKQKKPIDVTKANVKEGTKFKKKLDRELEKILKKLDLNKKPSESELNEIIDKAVSNLEKQLKSKSANRVKAIYRKELKGMSKDLGFEPKITEKDKNAIELLKRDPVFQQSFAGLSKKMSERLKDVMTKAYDNPQDFTIDKIVGKMKEEVQDSDHHLRNIARTEVGKISSSARKNSYEKAGGLHKFNFKHIGPNNERTTATCKRIMQRTKDGVPWEEYVNILQEESAKDFPEWTVNKEAPLAHYSCRHVPLGVKRKE